MRAMTKGGEPENPSVDRVSDLAWLEEWYASNCDGDWEHEFGVEIGTLDNPGWLLKVDLIGTPLTSRSYEGQRVERTEEDWFHTFVRDNHFRGAGGPFNLRELIAEFRWWVEGVRTPPPREQHGFSRPGGQDAGGSPQATRRR